MQVSIITTCTQEYSTKLNAQLADLTALVRSLLEENARRKARHPSAFLHMSSHKKHWEQSMPFMQTHAT